MNEPLITDDELSRIESRKGGFIFMWPSETQKLCAEIRRLRAALDESEWNEEMALIALGTELAEQNRPIKAETLSKIKQTVRDLTAKEVS